MNRRAAIPRSRALPRRTRTRLGPGIGALICSCSAALSQSHQGAAPAPKSGRVSHVLVHGDFEAVSPLSRLGAELERASAEGDALVVIEMDGDRGRSDVALAVFDLLRASKAPVAVYLADDADRSVGASQLCAGLGAGERLIGPGCSVRAAPGDDLVELAPADTAETERIGRQLSGAVYARLAHAGAPADLAELLVPAPGQPWPRDAWTVRAGDAGALSVVFEDPATTPGSVGAAEALTSRSRSGAVVLSLNADRLTRLGVVRATAASARAVPAAIGVRGLIRSRVTIDLTLAAPRAGVERDLAAADDLLRRAAEDLDLPRPPRQDISEDRYRSAAGAARDKVRSARALLARSEAVVAEYPELTRTPAPGQTEVGGKASVYATRWRASFQSRADRASKLEEKAATIDPAGRR